MKKIKEYGRLALGLLYMIGPALLAIIVFEVTY